MTRANDELNTVAQRIRYVGLSADEIREIISGKKTSVKKTVKKSNAKK